MTETLESITVIIKTIHRPWACNRLIRSLDEFAAGTKVHVLDDGRPELRFSKDYPETAARIHKLIETEHDIGLSAGRNQLLDTVETPYFVLVDDDHVFTENTNLETMLRKFELLGNRCDLLAFGAGHVPRSFALDRKNRILYARNHAYAQEDDVQWCDLVTNAFLAKTEAVRQIRWDARLKIYEHWDFFLRAMRQGMSVALSTAHGVDHRHVDNKDYRPIRYRGRYRSIVLKKHRLRSFGWHCPPSAVDTILLREAEK